MQDVNINIKGCHDLIRFNVHWGIHFVIILNFYLFLKITVNKIQDNMPSIFLQMFLFLSYI